MLALWSNTPYPNCAFRWNIKQGSAAGLEGIQDYNVYEIPLLLDVNRAAQAADQLEPYPGLQALPQTQEKFGFDYHEDILTMQWVARGNDKEETYAELRELLQVYHRRNQQQPAAAPLRPAAAPSLVHPSVGEAEAAQSLFIKQILDDDAIYRIISDPGAVTFMPYMHMSAANRMDAAGQRNFIRALLSHATIAGVVKASPELAQLCVNAVGLDQVQEKNTNSPVWLTQVQRAAFQATVHAAAALQPMPPGRQPTQLPAAAPAPAQAALQAGQGQPMPPRQQPTQLPAAAPAQAALQGLYPTFAVTAPDNRLKRRASAMASTGSGIGQGSAKVSRPRQRKGKFIRDVVGARRATLSGLHKEISTVEEIALFQTLLPQHTRGT